MPSHQRNHTAVIRWMLIVCLLYSGSSLEAQIEAQTPVLTQDAPSKSKETSDDSELKIQNYQLKHAKAAEVLKLFKQLHGGKTTATIDERTNSILFLANETNARELRESLALLDGPTPGPTPVLKGSSPQAPRQSTYTQLPEESKPAGPFRKFTFKHAKVADVVKILRELTGANIDNEDMEGFAVDERTNSVIWKVEDEWNSRHWEETLLTLDGENSTSRIQSAPSRYAAPASMPTPIDFASTLNSQISAQPTQTFTFSMGFERGESVESLKQRYNELEQQTHQLADKLKQSKSPSEPERTELKTAVRKSFEARQALQRAELADLAQRMKSMQQSIDMRDKLADKVIERRIEDLLNPNLKWDLLAAKDRTLDGHISQSSNGSATTAQSAPETPALTPESSAYLPPSIAPTPISVPYDPGKRPETIIMERIQGEWIAESMISAGKDSLSDYSEPFEVLITGNEMRFKVGDQDLFGPNPMLLTGPKGSFRSIVSADQPMPLDIVMDPNGENREMRSIIACDGTTLSICFAEEDESKSGFRPSSFIPGSKVVVIKCYRLTPTVPANKPGAANLSTPQATLDYLHRYSLAHPDGFPAECYTDEAVLELSGMMLQSISMMSAMSQIALQTGGVIGESNGVPVVSDTSPEFHIGVEALLKEHMLPTPPESADKAFELLATLTFGSTSSSVTAAVKVDRQLLRLAAGVLKSPKEFLPAADKLLETFGETAADVTKSQKADQTQPKADIAINGDEATATFNSAGNVASPSPLSKPRVTKLRRIDGRWLISEILSDQEITQLQSSYSSVMNQLGGAEAKFDTPQALLARVDECSKAGSYEEFIALFSDEGVRDLAGAMLMQAVMQTSIDELSRQLTFGGVAEDEPNFVAFRKVLQRWLPQSVTTAQQEAMGKGLSTIMSSTSGASPDHAALNEFVISLRESVAGIGDHRKFCIEIMQAFEKRTNRKFVFFGNADHENEWQISPFGDRAIATLIDGSPGMATTITLQQANGTWRISSLFNERIIEAQPATKSPKFNSIAPKSTGSDEEKADPAKAKQSSSQPTKHDANVDLAVFDWSDLLKLLPESETVLVMFSYEPDKREQMLPIAEKVAEEAAVKLIHLPIDNWRTLFSKEATHFVLMKDRQLIGTKTGLVTEAKLKEFIAQAKDWLTPHSTGVMESSLVRVDCYISPGKDNIGSQHGPAIPITLAVVAIDGDEALLFGTEGIAQYLEKGCACVAIVRDDKGKEKQVPIEVVLTGNVPLKKPDALNDDDALVITIPFFKYDKEYIELQEAYDVGSAIYRIRGAHGLTTVKLAPFDSTPQKGERVLAGEFNSSRHHGPILGFQSPFHWQTQQNLSESYSSIYGANIHGAKMFEVLCPTIPAPSSFLFNAHGRLIGTRGLGNLTEKDKTYTALMPYAIHSVLHAGLEAIAHAGLKAALKQTLEESTSQT